MISVTKVYFHLHALFFLVIFIWGTCSVVIDENGARFYVLGICYRSLLWKDVVYASVVYNAHHYGRTEGVFLARMDGMICCPETIKDINGNDMQENISGLIRKNKGLRLSLLQGKNIYIVGKMLPNKKWNAAMEIMRTNIGNWDL